MRSAVWPYISFNNARLLLPLGVNAVVQPDLLLCALNDCLTPMQVLLVARERECERERHIERRKREREKEREREREERGGRVRGCVRTHHL